MKAIQRLHFFGAGALAFRLLPLFATVLTNWRWGAMSALTGIGTTQYFNYSERHERWTMALSLLLTAIVTAGYLELCRVTLKKGGALSAALSILVSILCLFGISETEGAWQRPCFLLLAIVLFPWGEITQRWPRRKKILAYFDRPTQAALLAAFSATLILRTKIFSAWEFPQTPHPASSLATLVFAFVFFYLGFQHLLRKYGRPNGKSWLEIWLLSLPAVALVKIISSAIAYSLMNPDDAVFQVERHLIAAAVVFAGLGVFAKFLDQAMPLAANSRWPEKTLAFFTLPCLIYFASYEVNMRGTLDGWHDALLYQTVRHINRGGIPYKGDFFVLHGIGNAWMGALGMKIWGNTINGFRLTYHLLVPLVWVLQYLVLRIVFGARGSFAAFLATFSAACISSLNQPYPFFIVSWLGGTRTMAPLLTLLLLTLAFRSPAGWFQAPWRGRIWFGVVGITSALALFINMEQGVATIGAVLAAIPVLLYFAKLRWTARVTLVFCYVGGFTAGLFAFFTPFSPPSIFLSGLYRHIFVYPFIHEEAWGLPLLTPLNGTTHLGESLHRLYIFLPLILIAISTAYLLSQRKRRLPAAMWVLIPMIVYTGLVYQVGLSRSDSFHLRIGMGISGILLIRLLTGLTDRRSLLWVLLVAYFAQGYTGRNVDFERQWLVKDQREQFQHYSEPSGTAWAQVPFDPKLEGRYSVVSAESKKVFAELKNFTAGLPFFDGKIETSLAEQRPLYILFLNWQHAYSAEGAKLALFQVWNFDPNGLPRYAKWTFASHNVHARYVPCFSAGKGIALLALPEYYDRYCQKIPDAELDTLFPPVTDLQYLPSGLSKNPTATLRDPSLKILIINAGEPIKKEMPARLQWTCQGPRSPTPQKEIRFQLVPGTASYWIPISANPAWAYCPVDERAFNVVKVVEGEKTEPLALARPLTMCETGEVDKHGQCPVISSTPHS